MMVCVPGVIFSLRTYTWYHVGVEVKCIKQKEVMTIYGK